MSKIQQFYILYRYFPFVRSNLKIIPMWGNFYVNSSVVIIVEHSTRHEPLGARIESANREVSECRSTRTQHEVKWKSNVKSVVREVKFDVKSDDILKFFDVKSLYMTFLLL